ncbi:MAG TPA: signal peptidase I [Actinomycetota bacterium]|jgi:signal peptidase I|nr:signal peptidase I [Actinomycetota bacterium]
MRRALQVVVLGRSMLPTLSPGDRLLAVRSGRVRRGDVWVVLHAGQFLVKRVVGLPRDRLLVADGEAKLAGSGRAADRSGPQPDGAWVLGPDEYLIQGDNRQESTDLQALGPVGADRLVGRVLFRYWPRPGPVR